MTFANQLKEQLLHFVESYRKYFLKTYVVAMTFTILCYVASAVLLRFDQAEAGISITNLMSLIFSRHSYKFHHIIDLSTSFWFFFIAIFSLLLAKFNDEDSNEITEFNFGRFVSKITLSDIGTLLGVLAISCLVDFLLFEIYYWLTQISEQALSSYLYYLVFRLRQYIPLLLYGISIRWLLNPRQFKVTGSILLLSFLSLWVFNGLAFEFYIGMRDTVLNLLLLHFAKSELLIIYQSLLAIPIMGILFVGYYAALTGPLRVSKNEAVPEEDVLEPD